MNASWNFSSQYAEVSFAKVNLTQRTLRMNADFHSISANGKSLRLRSKLWDLLSQFIQHPNELITREQLIDCVWHGNYFTGERGLTHSICHLRRIFRELDLNYKIITVPKTGYLLKI